MFAVVNLLNSVEKLEVIYSTGLFILLRDSNLHYVLDSFGHVTCLVMASVTSRLPDQESCDVRTEGETEL